MILVGTSGYSYPEWKGSFYPPTLAAAKMLPFYAQHFGTVEINATFYRMPTAKTVAAWASQVPPHFRFTLKASKRITHDKRLKDVADPVRGFLAAAAELGPQLATVLFQLPPNFKQDLAVFDAFLETLPPGLRAAFEFRHASWWNDEVYARLRARNLALCVADSEARSTPVVTTADYGYLRLRDEGYQEADIARWAGVVRDLDTRLKDVFVYFKHEDEGKGVQFGQRLIELLGR
jgi:uncharacterized protein YecE (DUF72 family)